MESYRGVDREDPPRDLRLTVTMLQIDYGVRLEKVARLLSHGNLNTTLVYAIPIQADLAPAGAARLD